MSGEKAVAINRAWELWPNIDPKAVAQMVSGGWEACAAQAVSLPDRETLAGLLAENGPGWTSRSTYITREDALLAADAVLAALSTQPAAGEVEITDEQVEAAADVVCRALEDGHVCTNFHVHESHKRVARAALEAARGAQPETPPDPDLFPGTLTALDHLSIRPEAK